MATKRFQSWASLLLLLVSAVWSTSFHCASAWSDEGHMIIAAVAKLRLPKAAVDKLEGLLHLWDDLYPGIGTLEHAAAWLDHITCRQPWFYCGGFKSLEDFQLFRPLHYTSYPLNPQNIELEGVYNYYPIPEQSADWALKTVYKSLTETDAPMSSSTPYSSSKEDDTSSVPRIRGSIMSHNLHLRLLVHIFGDIHQPLHTTLLFAKGFPRGDVAGNAIHMKSPPGANNLHHFWDSGGNVFKFPFFRHTTESVEAQAKEIMAEFPIESFADRLVGGLQGDDFYAIAKESADLALKYCYAEFDWNTFSDKALPYEPSQQYIENSRKIARQQIALAGYRLTYVLSMVEKHLPLASTLVPKPPPSKSLGDDYEFGNSGRRHDSSEDL